MKHRFIQWQFRWIVLITEMCRQNQCELSPLQVSKQKHNSRTLSPYDTCMEPIFMTNASMNWNSLENKLKKKLFGVIALHYGIMGDHLCNRLQSYYEMSLMMKTFHISLKMM